MTLRDRREFEELQAARKRERTPEFRAVHALRAGVEATLSQGVRSFGLRRARYVGLAKTRLQHIAIAAAMNPPQGDWYYYVTVNLRTGETKFAASYDEFLGYRDELRDYCATESQGAC